MGVQACHSVALSISDCGMFSFSRVSAATTDCSPRERGVYAELSEQQRHRRRPELPDSVSMTATAAQRRFAQGHTKRPINFTVRFERQLHIYPRFLSDLSSFPQTVFRPPSAQSDEALGYSGGLPYQPAGSLTTSPQILQFSAFLKNFSPIQMEPSDDSVEAIRCCTFGSSIERTTEGIGFPRSNDDLQISTQGVGRANSSIIAVHCVSGRDTPSVRRTFLPSTITMRVPHSEEEEVLSFFEWKDEQTDKKRSSANRPPASQRGESRNFAAPGGLSFALRVI
jgi:hypothetical protein